MDIRVEPQPISLQTYSKNTMKTINKVFLLSIISSLSSIQTAQATSTYNATSNITITIDSITNHSNPGNNSELDVFGIFEIADDSMAPGVGQITTGDGTSSYSFNGEELDSFSTPITAGDNFSQLFSSAGSASNGSVDAYYQAFGGLGFGNSSSDSFTIEYSLNYNLTAEALGNFATTTVTLEYFNDLGDIDGYEEAFAQALTSATEQNQSSTSFILNLDAFEEDYFYADVSITGYAEAVAPVPVPAAGWLMLSGLIFLRKFRKPLA